MQFIPVGNRRRRIEPPTNQWMYGPYNRYDNPNRYHPGYIWRELRDAYDPEHHGAQRRHGRVAPIMHHIMRNPTLYNFNEAHRNYILQRRQQRNQYMQDQRRVYLRGTGNHREPLRDEHGRRIFIHYNYRHPFAASAA